ncbi:MAG: exonuclease SbcCD subunit D [Bryobacterales bacterium]|nr:exonuclease SbcCD subunit D [Bryobacterales bacterium]
MRLLHTADWHIGKGLRGRSRMDEHAAALDEVLDIVKSEKIDCFLHAGDVFDSLAPSAEAEQCVFRFFARLAELKVPAIVVAGNHDHPKRFEALQPLLDTMRIHLRPGIAEPGAGGVLEQTIGNHKLRVATVPFVAEHKLIDAGLLMGVQADCTAAYADRMSAMIEMLCEGFTPDAVNVLLGHLFVMDAQAGGSERAIHLAKPYAIPAPRFPTAASYIALGHLHRPQQVPTPSPGHYSGSLLQLDFGEQEQIKRVAIVDAKPGITAKMNSIPITAGRRLRDVRASLLELPAKAKEWNNGDYLRITVDLEKPQLGLADKVRELFPLALDVQVALPTLEQPGAAPAERKTPLELFERFYQSRKGAVLPDAHRQAFLKLLEEATHASR